MVTLEALCRGLPLVALDISGVRDHVPAEAGFKVRVGSKPETVRNLAAALEKLILSPELRVSSGRAGLEDARKYQWDRKALEMTEIYTKCVADAAHSSLSLAPATRGSRPQRSLADAD
jgi:glycosyltransferase involved in cell wall biosynthesis